MLLPPRISEALLIAELPRFAAGKVICTSLGRAQLAMAYAVQFPEAEVQCHFLDLYQAEQARETCGSAANVKIVCESDLPDPECDYALIPCTMSGNGELTRDLLQQACVRLRVDGMLAAATDNPTDRWLHDEMKALFGKVTRLPHAEGVVYLARKTAAPVRLRNFDAEFVFRDGPRLLTMVSRPGVFSHRELDLGARALLDVMEFSPGERVFEIGCGSGCVSVAAAAREASLQVDAVDSNPRAVECTRRSASLNQLTNVNVELNASGRARADGIYDVVLANPPYYSREHLARLFLAGAWASLQPGGRLYLVTRKEEWFRPLLDATFRELSEVASRGYTVFIATR